MDDTNDQKQDKSRKRVLVCLSINFCCYYRVALFWVLLTLQPYSKLSSIVFHNLRPVQCYLSILSATDPRRSFQVVLLNRLSKSCLKPEHDPIGFTGSKKLRLEDSIYFDDGLIGDFMEVEGDEFGDITDDKCWINDANNGLMGDPFLHGEHRNAIDILPVVDLMIREVFVMHKGALEGEGTGEDEPVFTQIEISGFDESIKQSIEMQAIPHGLTQYDVNFCVELSPTQHINYPIQLVLLHYLPHHIYILHLSRTVSIHYAVYFATTCPSCKNGVETIGTLSEMQDCLSCKKMLIFHNDLMIDLVGQLVLDTGFKRLQSQVVDFAEEFGVLQIQQRLLNFDLILNRVLPPFLFFFLWVSRRCLVHAKSIIMAENICKSFAYKFKFNMDRNKKGMIIISGQGSLDLDKIKCTLVFDDQGSFDFLHFSKPNMKVLVLTLQVDFVHLLQFFFPTHKPQQSVYFFIADLQPFLGFCQPVDLLFKPVALVEIIVDSGLIVFEGTVFKFFCLLLGLLILLGQAVLLPQQFVVLLFQFNHISIQLFGLLHRFFQQLLDVLYPFLPFCQLNLGDVQNSLLFAQLNVELLELSSQGFLSTYQFIIFMPEAILC